MTEVDWKIKSINLANKKVTTVATGGSYNNTPTPILRTGKNSVSWIQYDAKTKNPTVTSKLMNYDLTTKKTLL